MKTNECCDTCRWWAPNPRNLNVGQCRRHAPKIVEGPQGVAAAFPTSEATAWCGDHESADRVPVAPGVGPMSGKTLILQPLADFPPPK